MNHFGHGKTPFFFLIDFEIKYPLIIAMTEIDHNSILHDFRGYGNHRQSPGSADSKTRNNFKLNPEPISREKYNQAFSAVQREQHMGNSLLCNLTFPSRVDLPRQLNLKDIFHMCRAPYRLYADLGALIPQAAAGELPEEFLVFSPEAFVQTHDGRMYTYPMKGTAAVSAGDDVDDAGKSLLTNEKERAEHTTVVDLLRNDLGRVCSDVQVEEFRYISRIHSQDTSLLQVSSRISAKMKEDWQSHLGDMFCQLLPAGSVSGAPKRETCRIIAEAEAAHMDESRLPHGRRGYYCGVAGVFNGWNLDSAVLIRYMEQWGEKFGGGGFGGGKFFRSGGGITIYSDAESEYAELVDKIRIPTDPGEKTNAAVP